MNTAREEIIFRYQSSTKQQNAVINYPIVQANGQPSHNEQSQNVNILFAFIEILTKSGKLIHFVCIKSLSYSPRLALCLCLIFKRINGFHLEGKLIVKLFLVHRRCNFVPKNK